MLRSGLFSSCDTQGRLPLTARRAAVPTLALALAVVGGCGGGPPSPPPAPPQVTSAKPAAPPAPVACSIDGTVKDGKGAAVVGALVAVIPPREQTEVARVRTTAGGAFCVAGVAPGEYGLTITSEIATSAYVDVFAVGGDKGHGLDVKLGGPGSLLQGRVTAEGGRPPQKRTLRITRFSDFLADTFVVETDADGQYSVRLPPAMFVGAVREADAMGVLPQTQMDRDTTVDIVTTRLNPKDEPAPQAVVDWVKKSAVALTTAEAGHGFADMERLRDVVGGARVVALGEATHGTREFFQLKHRMLEFLVEKMGFRAFVIEATFPEALLLDDHVRTGKGDPYAGVAAMRFWTWDTEEVVEMVRWMRRYNEDPAHKEKLRFFGNDIQSPAGSVLALAGAIGAIDRKLWAEVAADLEIVDDDWSSDRVSDWSKPEPPPGSGSIARATGAAKKLAARLDEKRDADVKKLGAEGWALARIHAHVVFDFLEMVQKRQVDFGIRDRAMAENTLRLQEMLGPAAKVVVWAHNGHVQRSTPQGGGTMGHVLSERLKADLVVFGFSFDQGAFQAMDAGPGGAGLTTFTVGPAPAGSLDGTMARAGLPLFALDLRAATGSVHEWLHTTTVARSIGSMYTTASPGGYFDMSPPGDLFDALFFVGKTTAAQATSTGKRPKAQRTLPLALVNGNFEEPGTSTGTGSGAGTGPTGWGVNGYPRNLRYDAKLVDSGAVKGAPKGKKAALLERQATPMLAGMGSLAQSIDAKALRGKTVRIEGRFQVEGKGIGDEAYLMARTAGGDARTFSRQVAASRTWQNEALEVAVPLDATELTVSVIATGAAKVRVDDIRVAPVEAGN